MPSLKELRMSEWRAVPTMAVRAPRALRFRMRRLFNEVWCRLLSVAVLTLCLSWWDGSVKALMQSLWSSRMVHQDERSVEEYGPVANRMGGARGSIVYITQYGGRSA